MRSRAEELGLDLGSIEIVDREHSKRLEAYADRLYDLRKRAGVTPIRARRLLADPAIFGVMMVETGEADGLVCGLNRAYPVRGAAALSRTTSSVGSLQRRSTALPSSRISRWLAA